ncbi:HCL479Wp [Eremothecium sinecaudum]|uniref:lysine--tRNA ligase n=1 Tax=Eremothecium sinecaudum TaxID=45286 RepID=A0A109UYW0_9SACH|nr:HCL479Wp [Eremothecium sinecaudum]AMD19672.1 HCL479Wp [Eremothecium sinecaudum]
MFNFRICRTLVRGFRRHYAITYAMRYKKIEENLAAYYPSLSGLRKATITVPKFLNKYESCLQAELPDQRYVVNGQIRSVRIVGRSMCFIDLYQEGRSLQLILSYGVMSKAISREQFYELVNLVRPGDHVQAEGYPGLSKTEKTLSLKCTIPLVMLSASQIAAPPKLEEPSQRRSNRVMDYIVNGYEVLHQRRAVIKALRDFLDSNDFLEVETPLLSAHASGANARPFTTQLNALSKQSLHLRIAPELWLKRLSIAGLHKVYEIGKVFRNEGVDATHNPEFTTLEFYQSYTSMEELLEMSEELLKYVCTAVHTPVAREVLAALKANGGHFRRVEVLPTLKKETGIDWDTIDLSSSDAMLAALRSKNIHLTETIKSPSQILNKLCGDYVENKYCGDLLPTAICHHPTITSPLAKGNDRTSNRFEVMIKGREYINAYEEENCPQTQLSKLADQSRYKEEYKDQESMDVDFAYIEAMKLGMPPVGGLGLGIDRLCMLLLNKDRIEDVLPFGCLDDVNRQ